MTTSLSLTSLLLIGGTLLAALQLAFALTLLARGLWADWRVRKSAEGGSVLRDLLDQLEEAPSLRVRRELARRELRDDAAALDRWLDLCATRGKDPAQLEPAVYEDSGLVDRYLLELRATSAWPRRAAAAGLLGWTGSPRAVPTLLEVAQDMHGEAPMVRAAALRALGRIRHPDAIEPLLGALESDETWLPPQVAAMLANIGAPAVEPLSRRLGDSTVNIGLRRWAAQILGDIQHRRALPALLTALSDQDEEIRARAARSLAAIGDARAVDRLLDRLLLDPIPVVRASVAKALGRLGGERTLQFLVEALADPEWWVRMRAVEALEHLGLIARDVLIAALADADPQVRREAARALEGVGAVSEAIQHLRESGYEAAASEFLIEVGQAGNLEPLLDELEGTDEELLQTIVRILARTGDPRAGRDLATLLGRRLGDPLRARVVDALRKVHDGGHVPLVLPLLEEESEWLRKTAVDYLAEFAGPEVASLVLPLVDDPNPWTRESALRVLENLATAEASDTAVRKRLDDSYDFVRAQAVRTLCAAHDFETLLETNVMLHITEDSLRHALLQSLRDYATVVAMPLITRLAAFCADNDLDLLRRAARRAVAELEESEVDLLIFGYADPDQETSSRWFATVGWSRASEKVAGAWRDELLSDPDPRVRSSMVLALAERDQERADLVVALHRALGDPDPMVARAALCTIGRLDIHELESALTDALHHQDEEVRVDATLALALLLRQEGRPASFAVPEYGRRQLIAITLGRLHTGDGDAVVDFVGHLIASHDRECIDSWIEREHPLVRYIRNHAREHRNELAARVLLCRTPFEAERQLLHDLITDQNTGVRLLALEGAAALDSNRCGGRILSAFLKDNSVEVRSRALEYLVENDLFGRRNEYVERALSDPEESIRIRAVNLSVRLPRMDAARMLGEQLGTTRVAFQDAITQVLAGLIQDGHEDVLDILICQKSTPESLVGLTRILSKLAGEISTRMLEVLFTHHWAPVRAACVEGLIDRSRGEAWQILDRALSDPSPRVRARAVRAIAVSENEELVENPGRLREAFLHTYVDPHPEVRSRTALALAALKIDGASGMLAALERDEDSRVARVARRASLYQHRAKAPHNPGITV